MSLLVNYIIESTISLSVFYIFYELFLKRDTWFRFNRYYLLFGLIFSFILPLLDFSTMGVMVNTDLMVNSENQFDFNNIANIGSVVSSIDEDTIGSLRRISYALLIYCTIGSLFFMRFLLQFFKIIKTINAYEIINYKRYKIVLINKDSLPFSFFHYIFINKNDYGSPDNTDSYRDREESNELLMHEIVHAKQKHSVDIILLELLLVLQWFNPFIYRYRLAFKEIHEYLADNGVILKNGDKIAYQKLILDQIEKSFSVNLASQFNYSLTKKRIKMITRISSSKSSRLKAILILPLIVVLLSAFTIETAKESIIKKSITQLEEIEQTGKIPSIYPVKKVDGVKISSGYGMRHDPISKKKRMHNGTDIKAPIGTPVYATADGLIRKVKLNHAQGKGYGKYVIIDHEEGYSTLYAMLNDYNVKEGQEVKQGDIIAYVGSTGRSTGPHLHYEVMKNGENVDPEDYF